MPGAFDHVPDFSHPVRSSGASRRPVTVEPATLCPEVVGGVIARHYRAVSERGPMDADAWARVANNVLADLERVGAAIALSKRTGG